MDMKVPLRGKYSRQSTVQSLMEPADQEPQEQAQQRRVCSYALKPGSNKALTLVSGSARLQALACYSSSDGCAATAGRKSGRTREFKDPLRYQVR